MSIYEMKKPKRINAVSVSIMFIVLIIGYLGWAIVPIYWPIFQLSGIMHGTCNDAYRVQDDEQLMKKLIADAQRTKLPLTKDNFRFTRIPYSPEELEAMAPGNQTRQALMQKRGKECLLEMRYDASYPLPLLDQTIHWPFEREVRKTLEQVRYDKMCTCVSVPRGER